MTKVFIMVAHGRYIGTDGKNQIINKKAFKSRGYAEARAEEFRLLCMGDQSGPSDMDAASPIRIQIIGLEVQE